MQLIVSDGTDFDTLLKEDYINVQTTPAQASTPEGPQTTCQGLEFIYTTDAVSFADSYEWSVDPSNSGSFSGTGTSSTFTASASYTGAYTVKVRATNNCGDGEWSNTLACTMIVSPEVYELQGEGVYCEGSSGAELTLSGSETGVDYELYLDDEPTGNTVAGTGEAISFGFVTEEGIYTAYANSGDCDVIMSGSIWVHVEYLPLEAGVPQGPTEVCNDTTSVYIIEEIEGADTTIWILDPVEAGTLIPDGLEVTVEWNMEFSGEALLSVYGENDCGAGASSNELPISVGAVPEPDISGLNLVCDEDEADYQTEEHAGNSYYWSVEGGTIIDGAGTYQITVLWGEPGTGVVRLTEESAEGCEASTEDFLVTIDECTGIQSVNLEKIKVYPNPVK